MSKSQQRTRRILAIEPLESRQLLNGAPLGTSDFYPLPNNGTIAVGTPVGPLAADYTIPNADGFTREEAISVTSGQQQHPGFLMLGIAPDSYGEISVTNPGSSLTLNQWLEIGLIGLGRVSITNGGLLHTTNWTELARDRGVGVATVSGAGSRWMNDNFLVVGDHDGRGLLTIENGGAMVNGNHVTVGDDGGDGRMVVSGGSLFQNNNWTRVGPHAGAFGEVVVTGAGSAYRNKEWFEIGGFEGSTAVVTVADGATLDVGMWLDIHPTGRLRGDGVIRSGRFENRGTLEPGGPRGVMTIETAVFQTSSGTLEVEIGGASRGSGYDGLDVNGSFQAGGALAIKFINGFAPKAGDRFELVHADRVEGAFDRVYLQGLAPGFTYSVTIEDGVVALVATSDAVALPIVPAEGVLANDADADHDALSAILLEGPAKGTLQLYANGAFRYVAGSEFDGRDSFLYAASDGFLQSQPIRVTLTNLPPVGRPDVYHAIEDEVFVSPQSVLANDLDDMPGMPLAARFIGAGFGVGDIDLRPDGTFTYTPASNYAGNFTFLYVAIDGVNESDLTVVEVFVAGRDDPPTAVDDELTARSGERITVSADQLLANDFDVDGDFLRITDVGLPDPAKGFIEIVQFEDRIPEFTFTSASGFQGEVTFAYTISDRTGRQDIAQVTIQVGPPNRLPVASGDRKTMLQDSTLIFPPADLLRNDSDPDEDLLRLISVGNASRGEVFFDDSDDQITFRPPAGFVGTARFSYTISDGHGGTDEAFVDVEVRPQVQLVPGRVQGAGTLDGFERFFAFHADNRRGGSALAGNLAFIDVEQRLFFNSTSLIRLEISADGRSAVLEGEGRRNGRDGYQFIVTMEDRTARGQRDTFRIQITGPDDFEYDSREHAEQGGRIDRGGNIRILPVRPRTLIDLLLARQQAFEKLGAAPVVKGRLRI